MSTPPELFDRTALAARRRRAADRTLFLHRAAADEVDERLKEVNRTFTAPVVIAGLPGPWARFGPVIADADVLDLPPGAHDLVIHAMALHWSNDPVGQLIQCRRALRPDGMLIAALFGGETLAELRAALTAAEVEVCGGLSPRVAPMAEIRDLGSLLQRAGLALPVADSLRTRVTYRDIWHLMADLREMGEANSLAGRLRVPTRRGLFQRANSVYSAEFGADDGRILATFETIFLTGWAPGPDQPQALRPGSATVRLADALGVDKQNPEGT